MDIDYQNFETLLNEKLRERGLTLKRLSELSNISVHHLENLSRGKFEELPPAPYVRGYLIKIGSILDFDPEIWWERLRTGNLVKSSGKHDELPRNRFAQRSRPRLIWAGAAIFVVLIYFGIRFSKIFGEPILTVTYPDQYMTLTENSEIEIRGELKNGDGVSVYGEAVPIAEDGSWTHTITLEKGPNFIEIVAKKFLGRERKITLKILYEPTSVLPSSTFPGEGR